MRLPILLLLPIPLLFSQVCAAPPVVDWSAVSQQARRQHSPIMVVFSTETCGYCARLKREVIEPLAQDARESHRLLIREFDIDAGGKITDFDGEPIRSRLFKRRYGIFATPTLLILDADGHPLSDPLVGYHSADAYRELLHAYLVSSYEALE